MARLSLDDDDDVSERRRASGSANVVIALRRRPPIEVEENDERRLCRGISARKCARERHQNFGSPPSYKESLAFSA